MTYASDFSTNGTYSNLVTAMSNGAVLGPTENLNATPHPIMTDANYQTVSLALGQAALGMWITYGQTGSISTSSNTVTALSPGTGNLTVGQTVSGYGIPSGTTITAIISPSQITLSNTPTQSLSQSPMMITGNVTLKGNTTNGVIGVTNITPNTQGLFYGETISGTGIPPNTTINSVVGSSAITLSQKATATQVGVTLTVGTGAAQVVAAVMAYVNDVPKPLPTGTLSMDPHPGPARNRLRLRLSLQRHEHLPAGYGAELAHDGNTTPSIGGIGSRRSAGERTTG